MFFVVYYRLVHYSYVRVDILYITYNIILYAYFASTTTSVAMNDECASVYMYVRRLVVVRVRGGGLMKCLLYIPKSVLDFAMAG